MGVAATRQVGGGGGAPGSFNCPQNAFITQIKGRSGTMIDNIQFVCNDGTTSNAFGGGGGSPWTENSQTGFMGAMAHGGDMVDNLLLYSSAGTPVGAAHGGGGGSPADIKCQPGWVVYGANVRSGSSIDNLQFLCKPSTQPSSPSPLPSSPPSPTSSSPINCQMSDWIKGDCVDGKRKSTRTIITNAQNGGQACPTDREKIEVDSTCPLPIVPIDCKLSNWVPGSCFAGQRNSTRTIIQDAQNGGQACGPLEKTESDPTCNTSPSLSSPSLSSPSSTPSSSPSSLPSSISSEMPSGTSSLPSGTPSGLSFTSNGTLLYIGGSSFICCCCLIFFAIVAYLLLG